MPSVSEKSRQQFVEHFNRVLGSKTGRTMTYQSDQYRDNLVPEAFKVQAAVALAKKLKTTKAKKSTKKLTPSFSTDAALVLGLTGGKSSITPSGKKIDVSQLPDKGKPKKQSGGISGVFGDIQRAAGNVAGYIGLTDDEPTSDSAPGAHASLFDALHSANSGGPTQWAMKNLVERPFDISNRIMYAADEMGMQINQGGDVGDVLKGGWEGLSGKKKTGFRPLLDAAIPDDYLHPWLKTGVTFGAEAAMNPLSYYKGGSVLARKGATGAELRAGEATGLEAYKGEYGKAVEEALDTSSHPILRDTLDKSKVTRISKKGVARSTVRERIVKDAKDSLDKMIFEEKSGKVTGGGPKDTHGTLAGNAAERTRDLMVEEIKQPRARFVQAVSAGKRHTTAEFAALRKKNPLFGQWLDAAEEVTADATKAGTKLKPEQIAKMADDVFVEKLSPMVDEVYAKLKGNLGDKVQRIGRISMGNHDIYLPRVSKMVNGLKLGEKLPENFRRSYLMSSWLPGYTSHVSQKMRSVSKEELTAFKNEVAEIFHGTDIAERKLIKSATEADVQLTGKLGNIQEEQRRLYKQMFYDEIENGVRNEGATPYVSNYTFNRIKGGVGRLPDGDLERGWIEPRKKSMEKRKSSEGWTGEDAEKLGLRVENDAANALVQRKVRSLNKLTKTHLTRDLISHYGIKSRIPAGEVFERDLVKIDPSSQKWLLDELKPGESMYLHKDIAKVIDDYHELMSFNQTKEAKNAVKALENLTQIYKVANTMYWPGFHMRNAVSDMFMGVLDGVKAKQYPDIFKKLVSRGDPSINIGGDTFKFSKFQDSYVKNASSGFIDTEMSFKTNPDLLMTSRLRDKISVQATDLPPAAQTVVEAAQSAGNIAKKIHSKVRTGSEIREDFGRMVHYYHAMDEEYAYNIAKGFSKEKAWAKAEEASIARVNRFKFDYDALTPWEKKMRKYGIPFYTYMRKATPVLLENLMMNPRYYAYISKLQQQLAPSEEWQNTKEPSWMQEQNLSLFSDDTQPWGFTDALNPMRTVTDLFGQPDEGGIIGGLARQLSPAAQLPFEMRSGEDVFSHKPVNNVGDFLKNKWKGTTQYGALTGPKDPWEKAFYALGLPIYKVSEAQQAGKTAELEQTLQDTLVSYNKQLESKGLRVEMHEGKIQLVQPKSPSAEEMREGKTPRYPPNPTKKVRGTFTTIKEIPFNFK